MPKVEKYIVMLHSSYFDDGVKALSALAKDNQNIGIFTFEWDDDPREVWDIPEARRLILRTIKDASTGIGLEPILSNLDDQSRGLLFSCAVNAPADAKFLQKFVQDHK